VRRHDAAFLFKPRQSHRDVSATEPGLSKRRHFQRESGIVPPRSEMGGKANAMRSGAATIACGFADRN
jgi:hypothetical protein